jgi:hypothetical protein
MTYLVGSDVKGVRSLHHAAWLGASQQHFLLAHS